jgi:hypothetical protein
MKTGRVRKKEEARPEEPQAAAEPASDETSATGATAPAPAATKPARRPGVAASARKSRSQNLVLYVFIAIVVVIAVIAILTLLRGGPEEWVQVTRSDGTWTAGVTVLGPQVAMVAQWESECVANPNGVVQAATCLLKDTNNYQDQVVDDYEEYAYNIYYEETWQTVYQAQGTVFATTSLGQDDYWEGNRHYTRVEELDKDSCAYTNYTVWVEDPNDRTQELEVYLSDCEVWDHVTVAERIYDQQRWCQCAVTSLAAIGQQSQQGTGTSVLWPQPAVPPGGSTERSFRGQVTFLGGDYTYTATTTDLAEYQAYLTGQYYIGLRDGKPVTVSQNPSK